MDKIKLPCFIINLENRTDRKKHSSNCFNGCNEFDVTFIKALEHKIGAIGLWNTIKQIIINHISSSEEYILICEDDHQFTDSYSKERMFKCIHEAKDRGADILLGGVSSVKSLFEVTENLLWVEGFTGAQFTIIFRPFFNKIIEAEFSERDCADLKISELSSRIFLIYPFISTQKDFGYSDVTLLNHVERRIDKLFADASEAIQYILDSQRFYGFSVSSEGLDISGILLPVYVVNRSGRTDKIVHIKEQFHNKTEFEVSYTEICRHKLGVVDLWESIRKVVQIAINNEDDVIIICEDSHEFTKYYSCEALIRNIVEAHQQGCDILSGATSGGFAHALPVTQERYWVNQLISIQFFAIYRKFFDKILVSKFDKTYGIENFLSSLTCNKMVIYPFVSRISNCTHLDSSQSNKTNDLFNETLTSMRHRFDKVGVAAKNYLESNFNTIKNM